MPHGLQVVLKYRYADCEKTLLCVLLMEKDRSPEKKPSKPQLTAQVVQKCCTPVAPVAL